MKMLKSQIIIFIILFILVPLDFFLIFNVAPTERIMGDVQRIFYCRGYSIFMLRWP
jgi:hypothetical protein